MPQDLTPNTPISVTHDIAIDETNTELFTRMTELVNK
jgi:hypothetical protein